MLDPGEIPIKRIFVFAYQLDESRSLDEVRARLERSRFEILDPIKAMGQIDLVRRCLGELCPTLLPAGASYARAFVARSSTVRPTMIYFIFLQLSERGGLLVLLETKYSWYKYEKILYSMRAFNRNAGIKSEYVGLLIPEQKAFLTGLTIPENEFQCSGERSG